jgi:hypothetical protein
MVGPTKVAPRSHRGKKRIEWMTSPMARSSCGRQFELCDGDVEADLLVEAFEPDAVAVDHERSLVGPHAAHPGAGGPDGVDRDRFGGCGVAQFIALEGLAVGSIGAACEAHRGQVQK